MRITYFRLLNYAGIFNGMGLHELVIDFSKCKNIITVISGRNGVGKSTLMKAMTPLPDGSENFLEKLPAEKEIHIVDGNNVYVLHILSGINSNGTRMTTKAFISKNSTELNSTGNVTSYKDIVYSEFELDSNYITLSKLSSEDRGLAEKTPADRKKFIAAILESIDTYNAINKTLVKKSNIFKSYINNLSNKIQNTGNEKALRDRLSIIDSQYSRLSTTIEDLKKQRTEAETFIKLADPDGRIQDTYQNIYNSIKEINGIIESGQKVFEKPLKDISGYLNSDEYDKELIRLSTLQAQCESNKNSAEAKMKEDTIKRENLLKQLDIDNGKLINLKNGFEINNLRESVQIVTKEQKSLLSIIEDSKITISGVSRTEFETIESTITNIIDTIKTFYTKYTTGVISASCEALLKGINPSVMNDNANKILAARDKCKMDLDSINNEIIQLNSKIEDIAVLKDRPSNCTNDTCPFIVKAIRLQSEGIDNKLAIAESNRDNLSREYGNLDESYTNTLHIYSAMMDICNIENTIAINRALLDKISITVALTDSMELYNRIARLDSFDDILSLSVYSEVIDATESLSNVNNKLTTLQAELKIAEAKEESINMLEQSISTNTTEVNTLQDNITKAKSDVVFNKDLYDKYSHVITTLQFVIEKKNLLEESIRTKNELITQYRAIENNIKQIKAYIDKENSIDSNIAKYTSDMEPLQNEKDAINFSLTNLMQYNAELAQYQEKYNMITTLKKYSSPTTGIQTIYMNMYMGKTLSMANELLSMLFGGDYRLLPYIINENEFRIPFIGNGLTVDDVSRGSNSQKCMIGTIMNLVLLYQASTKYDIVCMDEIDGALDSYNRYEFINTVYQLIKILNINQLIMISHNIESDLSSVDVIKLKGYDNDPTTYQGANVIFDYNDYIKNN